MTQEEKDLLLKNLCSRLPYGVKVQTTYINPQTKERKDIGTDVLSTVEISLLIDGSYEPKPYLFPLENMTEEMLEELNANGFFKYRDTIANVSHLESKNGINEEIYTYIDIECISFLIKYFHSNHIDYKGFIETGLAIDATGLNIY